MASRRSARFCPLCRLLPGRRIAQQFCREGTYYRVKGIAADPEETSARRKRDLFLSNKIMEFWEQSGRRYGAVKIWHDMVADNIKVARCTVVRLMKAMGIQGITRGKVKTTKSNSALPCPEDKVNREFKALAPNRLWGRPWLRH